MYQKNAEYNIDNGVFKKEIVHVQKKKKKMMNYTTRHYVVSNNNNLHRVMRKPIF